MTPTQTGMKENLSKLFDSFLRNRTQQVVIESHYSRPCDIIRIWGSARLSPWTCPFLGTYQMNGIPLRSVEKVEVYLNNKLQYHGMIILFIFVTKQIDYSVF